MQICYSISIMKKLFVLFLFFISIIFCSCSSSRVTNRPLELEHLKFLSEYVIPYNKVFNNTIIGGLSGIDYDRAKGVYYLISDDRSEKNPARFYTAKILINKNKIDTVIFENSTFLTDRLGNFYPASRQDPYRTPDPEALRYNPTNNTFIWSSEGERIVNAEKTVLENPAITEINSTGKYLDTFQLPAQLIMQSTENGPRQNGVFEGLTFANNYQNLFVSVEEPLYQDGDRAGLKDSGIIRILNFDIKTKRTTAQYAYQIDPVAFPPFPANGFKVNGIPDILHLEGNKFLIIERSFSTGRLSCTIKVFLADISSAENIQDFSSLKNKTGIKFVSKKLLLNMDSLGRYIDNIEGVTFGPTLENGNKSLIFISDNNFNPLERTQFLLFEIQ
jgi:hypothetical protein